ncbi:MAG: hypothetical protein Q8R12_03390 [bacterium]|nr:hypothetical protein [bacterium]
MKQIIFAWLVASFIGLFLFGAFTFDILAQTGGGLPPPPGGTGGNLPPPSSSGGQLPNPIASDSFADIMVRVAEIVVLIGLPLVVIMLIYAGSLYVFARGSEESIKKAHQAFFWTVIGALLIVGAKAISLAIENFARQL